LPGLRRRYKNPRFRRAQKAYASFLKDALSYWKRSNQIVCYVAVDPLGYLEFTRRKVIAGLWRFSSRRKTAKFLLSIPIKEKSAARFAWVLTLVNAGILIAEGSCFGILATALPDTCEHRHFIDDNLLAIIKLMFFQLMAIAFGLIAVAAPHIGAAWREASRMQRFPGKSDDRPRGTDVLYGSV
jgi:hypothetical protein